MRLSLLLPAFLTVLFLNGPQEVFAADKNAVTAAITQQINQLDAKDRTKVDSFVEVVFVAAHPARIVVKQVKPPSKVKYLGSKDASDYDKACPKSADTGSPCKQRFVLSFDANKACRLDGKYRVTYAVECLRGASPGACSKAQQKLDLTLRSENFCDDKVLESLKENPS